MSREYIPAGWSSSEQNYDGTITLYSRADMEAAQKRIATLEAQNALLENQLQKLSYFTDPHAKGAIGRFLTADEIIREWASRAARFDEQVESLERQNALLRPVAEAVNNTNAWGDLTCGDHLIGCLLSNLNKAMLDKALQAANDGGAMGEG